MFDYVNFQENCPACGAALMFQTKDLWKNLESVSVCDINNFYGGCNNCAHGSWVEYTRIENDKLTKAVSKATRKPIPAQFNKQTSYRPDVTIRAYKRTEVIVKIRE